MRAPPLSLACSCCSRRRRPPPRRRRSRRGAGRRPVLECSPALDAASRSVTFEGRMRAQRGSVAMAMRFTLQLRAPEQRALAAAGRRGVRHVARLGAGGPPLHLRQDDPRPAGAGELPRARALPLARRGRRGGRALADALRSLPAAGPAAGSPGSPAGRRAGGGSGPAPATASSCATRATTAQRPRRRLRLDVPGGPSALAPVPALAAGESRRLVLTRRRARRAPRLRRPSTPTGVVQESDEAANVITAACPS